MSTTQRIPSQIRLAERVPNRDGAVFATLHTVRELEEFWRTQCSGLYFAAQGVLVGDVQYFLNEYEWIFAPTKAALIKAVTRWDTIGITCEWFDWAGLEPEEHARWFLERAEYRDDCIRADRWTVKDEAEYRADRRARTPESYRGYWTLTNLPHGCDFLDWFTSSPVEIIDPTLAPDTVAAMLQEMTFDDWLDQNVFDLTLHDVRSIEQTIRNAKALRAAGEDYYGSENEAFLGASH